jgi:hypothetical protein
MARLPSNNTVYPLLGRTSDSLLPVAEDDSYNYLEPVFEGSQFDVHSTTLSYSLGTAVKVELYFSSPITGDNIMRQSLPASYLEVKVSGTEDVEAYVDINGSMRVLKAKVLAITDRYSVVNPRFARRYSMGSPEAVYAAVVVGLSSIPAFVYRRQ